MRSPERPALSLVLVSFVALPVAHGLALLLRRLLDQPGELGALGLSAAVVAGALGAAVAGRWLASRRASAAAGLVGGLTAAALLAFVGGAPAAGLAAMATIVLAGVALPRVARVLPEELDGRARRRPLVATLWTLMALAAVLQTARISTFMTDAEFAAGPTIPGYFAHHMCLPAYLQAAEMNAAGEPNVYDPAHYPGLDPDAAPTAELEGMQRWLEDPFQYPPPFLLVSELVLAVAPDFAAARTGWFVVQALAFAAILFVLVRWVGGEAGTRALLLAPLLWLAPALNFNFQYGQAHLLILIVAVAGMLLVERGRDAAGGSLLAAATLFKLFPGLLLLVWVAQRRWRALGWATLSGGALVALSVAVLGTQPWSAFLHEHLPRLADGSAFAFEEAWPEARTVLAAGNQSPLGLTQKLAELGFEGARELAPMLAIGYLLAIAGVAFASGTRTGSRAERVATWLALLSLGSMQSGGAWAEYITVSVLWMLAFRPAGRGLAGRALAVLAWAWFLLLPGSLPPVFWEGPGAIALSGIGLAFAVLITTDSALAPERRPALRWRELPALDDEGVTAGLR